MLVGSYVIAAVVALVNRSANAVSWVFRISSAASGDEAITMGTSPRRSIIRGPCF
jgi:hypothetical protein